MMRWLMLTVMLLGTGGCLKRQFAITFDESVRAEAASGRLVVYLAREGEPGYRLFDPQPMYGVDVADAAPGEVMLIGPGATYFPVPLKNLESGTYRVRAVLDMSRENSSWRREPGNLSSDVIEVELTRHSATYPIELTNVVEARVFEETERVRLIETRSELLSAFRGRDVTLRAGVVLPPGYDPAQSYPTLYVVPGFGGDHFGAFRWAEPREGWEAVVDEAVIVVLDPEGPNGHTLFADSANNGPVGQALVEELIPAIEREVSLIADPSARLLRGHSSGGWSVIWLALTYPEVFGAAWSSAPDPVDFRAFQDIDIYTEVSGYVREIYDRWTRGGPPIRIDYIPSMRRNGEMVLSVRDESWMEAVLGPRHTSGQQWDSWFAVFGPRSEAGEPMAPWLHPTGRMHQRVARQYQAYDIGARVEDDPDAARLLHERVRILVGDEDSFYLNQAVALLAGRLAAHPRQDDDHGWVVFVPGATHGSVLRSPEAAEDSGRHAGPSQAARASELTEVAHGSVSRSTQRLGGA